MDRYRLYYLQPSVTDETALVYLAVETASEKVSGLSQRLFTLIEHIDTKQD